ncbi:feline leukemia virus subgroup C receptor-related protein 1-like [Anneissia japonica]|uniref:feline leukemia virus subgroup C receptor-related protein 1-like n=1 Tax=Anneissia japonica TaxID=1529436 RepID=UPI001425827B|nr:feline leukemia virus subgroup C receptor-related protein 1-like [Anneissia japonica]
MCIMFTLPALFILERKGLKVIAMCGGGLHLVGSWIRYVGILFQDSIYVSLIGQTLCGIAQTCCLGMASQLSGTWFGSNEVSLACALGSTALHFGIAIGFLTPYIFQNQNNIGRKLQFIFLGTAIFMSVIFPIIAFIFEDKPPFPPSVQKRNSVYGKQDTFSKSIKVMMMNRNFMLLAIACGLCIGQSTIITAKVKDIFLYSYPNKGNIVGPMVFFSILLVIVGSVAVGWMLDKTKQYSLTARVTVLVVFVTFVCFTVSMQYEYVWCSIVFFSIYYVFARIFYTIGFEYGAELTYPESESLSASIIVFFVDFTFFLSVYMYDIILENWNFLAANSLTCIMCVIPIFMTILIKTENKRHKADSNENYF